MRKIHAQDLCIALGFFALSFLFFWPVTLGGKTLLPLDNLFASQPWKLYAADFGVTVPHNGLLGDLILENYVWKRFILESLKAGRVPLWNPYLFAGVPFLAAGQHSALYPLSVLYYILPLPQAYGWFTLVQFTLTALFTFIYGRVIGLNRFGAAIAAITYTFSLFMIVQVVFPMIIAAMSWLPLLLAAIELVIRAQTDTPPRSPIPYVALGAVALGCEWLAGHVEIAYFTLIVTALYGAWRLVGAGLQQSRPQGVRPALAATGKIILWLCAAVGLGLCLGAIQIIPLYELVRINFRQGSVTLQQVIGWAYPFRHVLAFLMPDFYGNPSHHSYFDLFSRTVVPATRNYLGAPINTIEWGIKNYVEGGCYLGILPLFLTIIAILGGQGLRRQSTDSEGTPGRAVRRTHVWFFLTLAIFSLLLTFGTPLYAIIFYLPGFGQSHSPFRWIFPYAFSVSVLAGVGASYLSSTARRVCGDSSPSGWPGLGRALGLLAAGGGLAILLTLALSALFPTRMIPLAERVMLRLARAREAFADGRMFYSYQLRNVLILGILLIVSGIVLRLSRRPIRLPRWLGSHAVWKLLAILALVGDLYLLGRGFNSAADPRILDIQPSVVRFLKGDPELFRITTFDTRSTKPLPENQGMYFDLYDIRGYDSIIPKRYADYMGLIEEQGELLYNRIARLRYPQSLSSPLLDLLNVKYVLTEEAINAPEYTLVYDQELKVYRNDDYLPRAFVVYRAQVMSDEASLFEALRHFDPRRVALFEEPVPDLGPEPPGEAQHTVTITSYTPNQVLIEASFPVSGVLILADSHFPDWNRYFNSWKAYDTPEGKEEEQGLHIYRVDGNFRGVILGPGKHLVRFRYTPMSVKFGLFVSFFGAILLLLLVGSWAWRRYYREDVGDHAVRRVVKNTAAPIALTLLNRGMDMAFAMFMLRVLGPENAGKYTFAIIVVTWFEILTNFGLNTLLTREVARDHAHANRYLANTSVLRLALCAGAAPLILAFLTLWRSAFGLASDTRLAIILLAVGLIPSGISTGLSAVFNAYEKMEYPAAVSMLTTILKIIGGTLALLSGLGFVGLAGVSILVNIVTMIVLFVAVLQQFFRPRFELDLGLQRQTVVESYPLMLNHLLATLFFKLNVTLLQAMLGDRIVGYVGTAYKPIDALIIIPSYFTMALFPIMSRYAASARDSLRRAYLLSLKFLLLIALPIMVSVFFAARPIIAILGGAAYLPDSMIALQLMIGFLPFSFINSVTQYVLIALNQQRFLTRAFLIGVGFNLVANLLFIPLYGYRASAVITIFSELALLLPFYYSIRQHLGAVPWFALAWRPVLAAGLMTSTLVMLRHHSLLWTLPLALAIYGIALMAVGTFAEEDRALLHALRSRT